MSVIAASPFTPGSPGVQYAWDSTSLGLLKECAWKYWATVIMGYRSKHEAITLNFGIAVHECLERFYKEIAHGKTRQEALLVALRHALAFGGSYSDDGSYKPWETGDPNRNRNNLVRTIVWYEERYNTDATKTLVLENGEAAAELSFRYGIGEYAPDGTEYIFCGHLDRLIQFGEDNYVEDYKTTKTTLMPEYYKRYSPDNQMSMYNVAAKVAFNVEVKGVLVSAIQVAVSFTRFDRGLVYRTESLLEEWVSDTIEWIRIAEGYASSGKYPRNDKACSNYGGCPFRKVCSSDPVVRESFLERDFYKKPWNPLEVR